MENTNKKNEEIEQNDKKKISLDKLMVPIAVVLILICFAGVIYYANYVKPRNDIDKANKYVTEDYIKLGKTGGFTYEITQEQWDECVKEETNYYETVDRAAQDTDMVDYDIIGYVDGKKDSNITRKEQSITLGEDNTGLAKQIEDAVIGHKAGDKIELKDVDPSLLAKKEKKYSKNKVEFAIKVISVSRLVVDKVTDEWVKENYSEDFGLETTKEFYDWCKDYIIEYEAMEGLWQMAVDSASMNGYPSILYNSIVEETDGHLQASAEEQGMKYEEFLSFYDYTDEKLEQEYINGVKSELVMWQIVKDELFEASDEEIEEEYEDKYLDVGCDTVEEMKAKYTKDEIKESVLLNKVKQYIFENSTIKCSYKIS